MTPEQRKKNAQKIEEMKVRIRKKAAAFHELLNNPLGKELVAILEEEFYDKEDLRGDTVEETYYNLGARDVVAYLRTLQRIHKADKASESD